MQHFTSARWDTLTRYPTMFSFGFSIDYYRTLIDTWKAKANAVFTRQWSPDFDFSGGRRAQRAYFDAVKDLLAPTFTGHDLIRIPVLDRDPARAARSIAIIARCLPYEASPPPSVESRLAGLSCSQCVHIANIGG